MIDKALTNIVHGKLSLSPQMINEKELYGC
jgi:hypothetical protein